MKIEMKILNKKFYNEESNGMLLNPLPSYATSGSAAIDLVCTEDFTIAPGETKMIPTGLAIWTGSKRGLLINTISKKHTKSGAILGGEISLPESLSIAALIIPRSGLGTRGLILANTVGLIDEDYQGELMVSAWNKNKTLKHNQLGHVAFSFKAGDRFAQIMFIPVIKAQFEIVEEFSYNTERGAGGFNSTGS